MPSSKIFITTGILLLSSVLGCSGGEAATVRGGRRAVTDSSAGTVALGLGEAPYRPVAIAGGMTLAGTVSIHQPNGDSLEPARSDSVVAITRDRQICGDSANVRELDANAGVLRNALVWIDGITSGKPLPELRRDRLTIHNCRFEPRVLAVPLGSTINVFSRDRIEHDARFFREGAGEPVDFVRTFNAGSVVPSEKIAKEAGIVEVRSTLRPWARGFIAVFNHPYYAVTDDKGSFAIDGLPAGTYTVKVWHEGLSKPTEQRVLVGPSGSGRLELQVPLS